jgi:hypothetical protein
VAEHPESAVEDLPAALLRPALPLGRSVALERLNGIGELGGGRRVGQGRLL